jgi:hypothetical protein
VRKVGSPTNPAGGETVLDVRLLKPADAIAYLSQFDNDGPVGLVALAADLGLLGT